MKTKMTRQKLIDYIAKNNGFGFEVTKQFTTEELQKAFDSLQGAYLYIKALVQQQNPSN